MNYNLENNEDIVFCRGYTKRERERKKNNSKLVMLNLVRKHQVVFTQAYSNHNFQGMATMGVVKFSHQNI